MSILPCVFSGAVQAPPANAPGDTHASLALQCGSLSKTRLPNSEKKIVLVFAQAGISCEQRHRL
jgi:hypothetical protein